MPEGGCPDWVPSYFEGLFVKNPLAQLEIMDVYLEWNVQFVLVSRGECVDIVSRENEGNMLEVMNMYQEMMNVYLEMMNVHLEMTFVYLEMVNVYLGMMNVYLEMITVYLE